MTPDTRGPPSSAPNPLEAENSCIFWTDGRANAVERATEALVEVVISGDGCTWGNSVKDTVLVTNQLKKMLKQHVPMSMSATRR